MARKAEQGEAEIEQQGEEQEGDYVDEALGLLPGDQDHVVVRDAVDEMRVASEPQHPGGRIQKFILDSVMEDRRIGIVALVGDQVVLRVLGV